MTCYYSAIRWKNNKKGKKDYFQVEVTRDVIDVPSVKSKVYEKDWIKIGYIEILTFWEQTNKLFTHAISEILSEKVKGVIGIIEVIEVLIKIIIIWVITK